MNSNTKKPGSSNLADQPIEPARKSVLYAIIISGVLIVGLVVGYETMTKAPTPPAPESSSGTLSLKSSPARPKRPQLAQAPATSPATAPSNVSTPPTAPVANPTTPNAETLAPRVEASPQTRQLMSSLTQIGLGRGALTREQVDQWKQNFQQLTQQGAAAVPAIREFLEKNQDLNFTDTGNAKQLGYSSLRAGLIDALSQIGGPEATSLTLQTLQTTADPFEIAQLARSLEQQAPGQYRQEALNAARDTLALAAKGDLGKRDVAPLFQMMQTYGDSSVVPDLEKYNSQYKYYATISLAELPNGEGIPSLIKQVSDPAVTRTTRNDFALELLAQVSNQFPEARDALLEQAKLNRITDSGWRRIASNLAGEAYQIGPQPMPNTPGMKGYHIESGNQNFYSLPLPATGAEEQINQRIALIDQLLSGNSNQAAVQALQNARTTLTGIKK